MHFSNAQVTNYDNLHFTLLVNIVHQTEDHDNLWAILKYNRNNFLNNNTNNLKCFNGILKHKEALMNSLLSNLTKVSEDKLESITETSLEVAGKMYFYLVHCPSATQADVDTTKFYIQLFRTFPLKTIFLTLIRLSSYPYEKKVTKSQRVARKLFEKLSERVPFSYKDIDALTLVKPELSDHRLERCLMDSDPRCLETNTKGENVDSFSLAMNLYLVEVDFFGTKICKRKIFLSRQSYFLTFRICYNGKSLPAELEYNQKLVNHPVHVDTGTFPSAFIPFCGLGKKMFLMGEKFANLSFCSAFRGEILNNQLCYQIDVNQFKEKMDQREAAEYGLFILIDTNDEYDTKKFYNNQTDHQEEHSHQLENVLHNYVKFEETEKIKIYFHTMSETHNLNC